MRWGSILRRTIRRHWFGPADFKYHFIHIPKNGGVTVRRTLEMERDVSLSSPYHYRYIDIVDQVGRGVKYFGVVRNPWSRTASRYLFAQQNLPRWALDDPRRKYMETATFEDFVRDQKIFPNLNHPEQPWMGPLNSWFNQLEWLRDENGQVVCDCLRLECLDDDLSNYLGRPIKVAKRNMTRKSYDYRSMYTSELTDIVAKLFREDIEYFGFQFDSPAMRNMSESTR